ncbi:RNA-binding S4 domain-containing protein [Qipengyuania sp. GH38]|uniref:RNA-binding S4 domain-containing protein n=1 Tax=Qipengyuania intermedia TaxID=2867244 RepID=UPI001C868731|nr:RNA-binding S4 domain-containing protein [Qipengyuania intermedia]
MRIDRLLCLLRFVRTRSAANKLVGEGHIRRNGERVTRSGRDIQPGDVLTLPLGNTVRLIEVLSLPDRRGPPREAQACYRELDPDGQNGNSSGTTTARQGNIAP